MKNQLRDRHSPSSNDRLNPAFVIPFSWEEKPGIPKEAAIASSYIPQNEHLANIPLSKPPSLEKPPCTLIVHSFSASTRNHLTRKHSFADIYSYNRRSKGTAVHLIRKHSHGSLPLSTTPRKQKQERPVGVEDDPFFMAMEACQKGVYSSFREEPIRVYYQDEVTRCEGNHKLADRLGHGLTIRELFMQQLQEDAELLIQPQAQKQPLKSKGFLTMFGRCLGCR